MRVCWLWTIRRQSYEQAHGAGKTLRVDTLATAATGRSAGETPWAKESEEWDDCTCASLLDLEERFEISEYDHGLHGQEASKLTFVWLWNRSGTITSYSSVAPKKCRICGYH